MATYATKQRAYKASVEVAVALLDDLLLLLSPAGSDPPFHA